MSFMKLSVYWENQANSLLHPHFEYYFVDYRPTNGNN